MNLEYEIDKLMLQNLTDVGELLHARNPNDGTAKARGYDLAEKQVAEAIVSFGYWSLGINLFLDGRKANEFVRKSAGVTKQSAKEETKFVGSKEPADDKQSGITGIFRAAKIAMFGNHCDSGRNKRSVQDY